MEGGNDRTQTVRLSGRIGKRKTARSHRPHKDSRIVRQPLKDQPPTMRDTHGSKGRRQMPTSFTMPIQPSASTILPQPDRTNNSAMMNRRESGHGMAPAPLLDSIPHTQGIRVPGSNSFGQPIFNVNIIESSSECPYVETQIFQSTQFQSDKN